MSHTDELGRVALLRARLASSSPGVEVGIGDDAAVLAALSGDAPDAKSLVWTVDAQVEGTHFRTAWASWEDIGWRSYMAAASDLAAMGAEPVAALSSLALAPSVTDEDLDALARGQALAARKVGAPIVGGNVARASETSITTTLLGRVVRPILRSGARPGDGVWIAGALGMAAAGLAALAASEHGSGENMQDASVERFLRAWRRPEARIAEGVAASAHASAAIDISDGLARDAMHVADASGVRIVLAEAAVLGAASGATLDQALYGGEDYALLVTSTRGGRGFTRIGDVEAYDGAGSRLVLSSSTGGRSDLAARGFDHFAK